MGFYFWKLLFFLIPIISTAVCVHCLNKLYLFCKFYVLLLALHLVNIENIEPRARLFPPPLCHLDRIICNDYHSPLVSPSITWFLQFFIPLIVVPVPSLINRSQWPSVANQSSGTFAAFCSNQTKAKSTDSMALNKSRRIRNDSTALKG